MPCFDFYIVTCSYSSHLFLCALGTRHGGINVKQTKKRWSSSLALFPDLILQHLSPAVCTITWGKVTNPLLVVQATSMLG